MLYVKLVRRAARALDTYKTEGQRWVLDVDVDRLDQGSLDNCVLGQLFGDFYGEASLRFQSRHNYLRHAFGGDYTLPVFSVLTWAWRRELRRRRAEIRRRDDATTNDDNARYGGRREWLG